MFLDIHRVLWLKERWRLLLGGKQAHVVLSYLLHIQVVLLPLPLRALYAEKQVEAKERVVRVRELLEDLSQILNFKTINPA